MKKAANPTGVNLAGVSYFSSEQPFLNLVKAGGASTSNYGVTGWQTATNSTWDTNEEAYLPRDADGYPTSLTASPTPPGGQKFNFVRTLLDYNQPTGTPGQTYAYPPGTYRLRFEGQGTVQVGGDASFASGDTCPSNLALSNSASNSFVSCTFTVGTPGKNGGIILEISAIKSSTDNPRDISIVQDAYVARYDAGGVFNPMFISAIGGFTSLRFMDWMATNAEFSEYSSNTANAGATSVSLSGPWEAPSGAYPIVLGDGEKRTATLTLGSSSVSWSGGLSGSSGGKIYVVNKTWANRSRPSNAFWSLHAGVPVEVMVALCNQIGANCHMDMPLMYSDADISAMTQMVMSGTGMQSGYSPLSASLNASFELSNEVWNGTFTQYAVAGALGGATWPSSAAGGGNYQWNRNYFGMRTAQMANDMKTAVGSSLFARVIPVLGAQGANPYSATYALQTPYWTSGPASNAPIKAVAIAPYWGGNPSSSDCSAMTGQSDGGLADFFAVMTGRNGARGTSYSSVPSAGWIGQNEGFITAYVTAMAAYPSMKLIAYEGGQNFFATTGGTCSGWPKLVTAAERDARMGTAYATYLKYWQNTVGGTSANINNLFNDVTPIATYGAWGMMESIMQPISPLSSAPVKYAAVQNFMQ